MKEVRATLMTDTRFRYRCTCHKGYHTHGNGGDALSNRTEHRSSHCAAKRHIWQEMVRVGPRLDHPVCRVCIDTVTALHVQEGRLFKYM